MSPIAQDLSRLAPPTPLNALKWYFVPRGECFRFNVWLRVLQWLRRRCNSWACFVFWPLSFLAYLVYRHYEFKYGIHANANIEIGGGLRVVHGPCNLNAGKIGKNFTVYSGVTIGRHKGALPTIGDDVRIYPNAVVVGGIEIADRAVIGALTYVDKPVPADGRVIGR